MHSKIEGRGLKLGQLLMKKVAAKVTKRVTLEVHAFMISQEHDELLTSVIREFPRDPQSKRALEVK